MEKYSKKSIYTHLYIFHCIHSKIPGNYANMMKIRSSIMSTRDNHPRAIMFSTTDTHHRVHTKKYGDTTAIPASIISILSNGKDNFDVRLKC